MSVAQPVTNDQPIVDLHSSIGDVENGDVKNRDVDNLDIEQGDCPKEVSKTCGKKGNCPVKVFESEWATTNAVILTLISICYPLLSLIALIVYELKRDSIQFGGLTLHTWRAVEGTNRIFGFANLSLLFYGLWRLGWNICYIKVVGDAKGQCETLTKLYQRYACIVGFSLLFIFAIFTFEPIVGEPNVQSPLITHGLIVGYLGYKALRYFGIVENVALGAVGGCIKCPLGKIHVLIAFLVILFAAVAHFVNPDRNFGKVDRTTVTVVFYFLANLSVSFILGLYTKSFWKKRSEVATKEAEEGEGDVKVEEIGVSA